jgi:hypothetical protein
LAGAPVRWFKHNQVIVPRLERVNDEKLRHPVRHDLFELLSGYRLEAAWQLGACETGCQEISLLCRRGSEMGARFRGRFRNPENTIMPAWGAFNGERDEGLGNIGKSGCRVVFIFVPDVNNQVRRTV